MDPCPSNIFCMAQTVNSIQYKIITKFAQFLGDELG